MLDLHEDKVIPALLRKLNDSDFHFQLETLAGVEHGSTIGFSTISTISSAGSRIWSWGTARVFDYCVRKIKYSSSQAGRANSGRAKLPQVSGVLWLSA